MIVVTVGYDLLWLCSGIFLVMTKQLDLFAAALMRTHVQHTIEAFGMGIMH